MGRAPRVSGRKVSRLSETSRSSREGRSPRSGGRESKKLEERRSRCSFFAFLMVGGRQRSLLLDKLRRWRLGRFEKKTSGRS